MRSIFKTSSLILLIMISSCASNKAVTQIDNKPKKEKRQKYEYTPTKMDKLSNVLFIICIPIILSIEIFD